MLLAVFVSCTEEVADPNQLSLEKYDAAFAETFCKSDQKFNFNMAGRFIVTVDPEGLRPVKIYAQQGNKFLLTAHYTKTSRKTPIDFNAAVDASVFVVDIDGKLFVVNDGGSVRYSQTSNFDKYKNIVISDDPYKWIVCMENDYNAEKGCAYDEYDMDFNDAVLAVTSVELDDSTYVTITPAACGDSQRIYLHMYYSGTDYLLWPDNSEMMTDCEFHQWFGVKDFKTCVNTGTIYINGEEQIYNPDGGWASQDALGANIHSCTLLLPKDFDMVNISESVIDITGRTTRIQGLYFSIGTFKSFYKMADSNEFRFIAGGHNKNSTHLLIFPDDGYNMRPWRWPIEHQSLAKVYPDIVEYLSNPDNLSFSDWYRMLPSDTSLVY